MQFSRVDLPAAGFVALRRNRPALMLRRMVERLTPVAAAAETRLYMLAACAIA
jgi:hypothetical protein